MTDDIVTEPEQEMDFVEYLRLWASPDTNGQAVRDLHKAADEIERLRNMLAHGLVFGSTCEGCLICEQLKEVHEQTLREIALENQTNG